MSSSFDSAYQTIAELVNDFKTNEQHYLNPAYSEADVRNDFINKFFIALGWDVRHDIQKNPYEQEVRVEKPVLIAKAQKRADYSFSIAPNFRTIKFFVEAKKPAHALENKDYYFQTARYGWNASTPVAVLTDFEEFHIVDCRFRPNINDALNYKLEKFLYTDYTDKEKFAKIYFLFSREAVVDNSIEKYAESLPKPRGKKAKGLKAVAQTIDESFLEELDEIRNNLAKSFKKNNTHLSSEELTEATQRTIDRLVFIKFLEDKLIEPEHYVSQFVKPHPYPSPSEGEGLSKSLSLARRGTKGEVEKSAGVGSAWEKFIRASRTLDAKYNGVVFKKSLIDTRNIIEPDDKTFSAICEELSHENTPYNFDAIPIHILGSIYERFLGKVVNATDKRVTIEEKPEVRKAGGVYYTPQYIVNYIVDNTIGKLIEGKAPKEIAKMRFADIACGSGSFLITVFERLLDYHKRWYVDNPGQAKKDGCILIEGSYHLSLKQKTKILLNNIYGVDIDQQAVEVTQLSLYLKLLEDETTATANDSWVMFKEQLLPDLNKNIVCGNSLIGTDILNPSFALPFGKGEGWVGFDELKLKPMDFETVFPEVMNSGGFDAIVGNPPYVFTRDVEFGESVKTYYKKNYLDLIEKSEKTRAKQTGKVNLYALFLLRGIKIIKNSGLFSYIIPNTILRTTVYEGIRKYLLDNTSIQKIIDLKSGVFKGVTASTVILILGKDAVNKKINIIDNPVGLNYIVQKQTIIDKNLFYKNPSYSFNIFVNPFDSLIFQKMRSGSELLENIVNIYNGIATFKNKEGLSRNQKNKSFKKILMGKDISRYAHTWNNNFIEYVRSKLQRPREEGIFLSKEKLIMQRIGGILITSYDDEQFYTFNSVNNLILKNSKYSLKYVLGILNSNLMRYYYIKNFTNESMLTVNISKTYLDKLPFPNIDIVDPNLVNRLFIEVDQMLAAKKQLQQATTEGDKNYLNRKCETLDKQIDELVYKLYGLTEEEIKIVEGN